MRRPGPPSGGKKFDQKKEVRAIARERVGAVKAARVIVPKTLRKKPKYKQPLDPDVVQD
jgi:hypothetical protein